MTRLPRDGRRVRTLLVLAGALSLAALGCQKPESSSLVEEARFGIFYGGQIQERNEIPFELDAARQRQGFRLVLSQPLPEPSELFWEFSRPGKRRANDTTLSRAEGRVTALGSATLSAGQQRFEEQLVFRPGDQLGLWNVRVWWGERVLIDRPFTVYDADARRLALESAGDAGL